MLVCMYVGMYVCMYVRKCLSVLCLHTYLCLGLRWSIDSCYLLFYYSAAVGMSVSLLIGTYIPATFPPTFPPTYIPVHHEIVHTTKRQLYLTWHILPPSNRDDFLLHVCYRPMYGSRGHDSTYLPTYLPNGSRPGFCLQAPEAILDVGWHC